MDYVSTRGAAPILGFADALLAGLARDGGLYLPLTVPHLPPDAIRALRGVPYPEAASRLVAPFVGKDFDHTEMNALTAAAYSGFRHAAIAPLTQVDDNLFMLELFHGPTLAFKDVAMQWLGQAMNRVLRRKKARATIIGATSGDTGAAAIEAFAEQSQVEVFILYPQGRVSDVQRRQMTTANRSNVHALAIQGSFDDCQRIVKELFGDLAFRDEMRLSGVNSINWARILAQIVYYFVAAAALGAPDRPISFAVPTGNFGDVLAGYYAKRMGLPIERLIVATNENDILVRTLATGRYDPKEVKATRSPSMDIQVSSNFERLLFEASDREPRQVVAQMSALAKDGSFTIPASALARIRGDFDAFRVDEPRCAEEMGRVYRTSGMIIDPHSAVGVHAARKALEASPATPVIALATAHPAKFPDAVEAATGVRPALPDHVSDLMERKEAIVVLPDNARTVADYMRQTARVSA
ncbi:MAG TPA: threonine synthase [Roseiarcus sp.]